MKTGKLKILHIAPQNFAGMPMDFVKMHRQFGAESHLVTLFKNTLDFEEDICLYLHSPAGSAAKSWRDKKVELKPSGNSLKYYKPHNSLEKLYFSLRDLASRRRIEEAIKKYDLLNYDIYHFDGGMDLYRNLNFAARVKEAGKKIVCCYFGSDLRTRGIFKEIDEMSDLNLTVEFDHLKIHPNINYLFFPFDVNEYSSISHKNEVLKIVHSPTNRKFKGTDAIISKIEILKKQKEFEFVLLENMHREEVLKIKGKCDLAIDQVGGISGGSGYGKNSLETISMGLPTFTEFSDDYLKFLGEHPFVHSTIDTLNENLSLYLESENKRKQTSAQGFEWVNKTHSFSSVNAALMKLYQKHNII